MKLNHFIILASGLLVGLLADAGRWALGTADWNAALPWVQDDGWVQPNTLTTALNLLLGVAATWVLSFVNPRQGYVMLAVAVTLCFTGAAAASLHDVELDPFPPALALLLGGLAAWWLRRRHSRTRLDWETIFAGQLSHEALTALAPQLNEDTLAGENRPVWLLGVGLHQPGALRKKLGPASFLTLSGDFRKRAVALLLTRQALILPGSGDAVWAAFGLPVDSEEAGAKCLESAELVRTALTETFPAPAEFCFAVQHGVAASGLVDGAYQISGEILESGRQLLEAAFLGQIVTDTATSKLLQTDAISLAQVTDDQRHLWELCKPESPTSEVFELEAEPAEPAVNTSQQGPNKSKKKRRR